MMNYIILSEKKLLKKICNRLHYIGGQLRGVERMLMQNRSAAEVILQLLAIESGLNKLIYKFFDKELRKEIAARIHHLTKANHREPDSLETLYRLSNRLPGCSLRELQKMIEVLQQMEKNPEE